MAVPFILHNSTETVKFVIDADELNANFESLSDGSGLDPGCILPVNITSLITDFRFPGGIILGLTNVYPTPVEGMIFYHSIDKAFYGYSRDGSNNLQLVVLG